MKDFLRSDTSITQVSRRIIHPKVASIARMCRARDLGLHVFPWRAEIKETGLLRDAAYLVRPDGYVALADREGRATAITSYLDSLGLKSLQ